MSPLPLPLHDSDVPPPRLPSRSIALPKPSSRGPDTRENNLTADLLKNLLKTNTVRSLRYTLFRFLLTYLYSGRSVLQLLGKCALLSSNIPTNISAFTLQSIIQYAYKFSNYRLNEYLYRPI